MPDYETPELVPKPANVRRDSGRIAHFDSGWIIFFAVLALVIVLITGKPDPFRRIVTFVSDGMGVTIRLTIVAFLISGALLGLAAATDIQGELAYMRADWNPAYGLAVVPQMASPFPFIHAPISARRSTLGPGIRPSLVGPTFNR